MLAEQQVVGQTLADRITADLQEHPGSPAKAIARRLGTRKTAVNSSLYQGRGGLFCCVGSSPPFWYLVEDRKTSSPTPGELRRFDHLYAWQLEALLAWNGNGRSGIVEAVTGAGKTELALAAIELHRDTGGKVAVMVPGVDLARQWEARLRSRFPSHRIGVMGDGRRDRLARCEILIAVVSSAYRWDLGLGDAPGLLVADEVHRYGTDSFALALEPVFTSRLGLTATLARSDDGVDEHLLPYFGKVVYTLGYERALADDIIARYQVALVGVDLSGDEQIEYDRLTQSISAAGSALVRQFGVTAGPFRDFMAEVTRMSNRGSRAEGIAANRWLSACRERRALLAEASGKMWALDVLAPSIIEASRSLVFTETIESAEAAAAQLSRWPGMTVASTHSRVRSRDRAGILDDFAGGRLQCVVAPRILDEGVDVAEADLAVVLAASRERRQMIQRMGRVLRRKPDGRRARFVIVYVRGSSDDPTGDQYEGQYDELLDAADDEGWFDVDDIDGVNNFLTPG